MPSPQILLASPVNPWFKAAFWASQDSHAWMGKPKEPSLFKELCLNQVYFGWLVQLHVIITVYFYHLLYKKNDSSRQIVQGRGSVDPLVIWSCCTCRFVVFENIFYLFSYLCISVVVLSAVLSLRGCTGFSVVAASEGYSSLWCMGFSLRWLLLLRSTGSRALRLQ